MFDEYRERRFAPPPTLRKLVAAGCYGRKSGRGFYDYSGEEPVPQPAACGPTPRHRRATRMRSRASPAGPSATASKAARAGQDAGARARRAAGRRRVVRRGGAARQLGRGRPRRRRRRDRHGDDRRAAGRADGQRPDRQGRLVGPEDGREDPAHPGAGAAPRRADGLPRRLGRRAHHRPGADVPRPPRRRAHLLQRGALSGRRAAGLRAVRARAPRAAPTSRRSATS